MNIHVWNHRLLLLIILTLSSSHFVTVSPFHHHTHTRTIHQYRTTTPTPTPTRTISTSSFHIFFSDVRVRVHTLKNHHLCWLKKVSVSDDLHQRKSQPQSQPSQRQPQTIRTQQYDNTQLIQLSPSWNLHHPFLKRRRSILHYLISSSGFISLLGVNSIRSEASFAQQVPAAYVYDESDECRNGVIAAETAIPGAYQNICMTLPSRSFTLQSTGDTIDIYQGVGVTGSSSSSVTGRTGVALWNSGLLLARLLDRLSFECGQQEQQQLQQQQRQEHQHEQQKSQQKSNLLFQGKTVIELGCGTGLASIIASKLGAEYVYATDGNVEVLQLAKENLERNGIFERKDDNNGASSGANSGGASSGASGGEASVLKWGLMDAADYDDLADVIIGSDLTYNSGTWRLLSETLSTILKPNGIVIYLTLGHSGFDVASELNGFLTVIQSAGDLEVISGSSKKWPYPGISSLNSLLDSSLSLEEKNIVDSTGGYQVVVLKQKNFN